MTAVMIDIETKGKKFDTIVLTIGAVKFDLYPKDNAATIPIEYTFYAYPDIVEQEIMGRTTDKETMAWWKAQNPLAMDEAFRDELRRPVEDVLLDLYKFCADADTMWAQGPQFDMCILEHLYKAKNLIKPWKYSQVRDSRTLFAVLGDARVKNKVDIHNALADATSQAFAVQECFRKLNDKSVTYLVTTKNTD
jgi:3' exoribonuclease, RNase T-like